MPTLISASFLNTSYNVGDIVDLRFQLDTPGLVLSAIPTTLGLAPSPFTASSLTYLGVTGGGTHSYQILFPITEGGTDIPALTDVPFELNLSDGTTDSLITGSVIQTGDLIDANTPVADLDVEGIDTTINFLEASDGVTFSGTVEDDDSTVAVVVDGAAPVAATVSGGMWTVTIATPVTEADIVVSVTETDAAGNISAPVSQTFSVDLTAPTISALTVDSVTLDNTVNATEAAGMVTVTGSVTSDGSAGTVTLTIGSNTYDGPVSGGMYSINVSGSDLTMDGDTTIEASVTMLDAVGNSTTLTANHLYSVDTILPAPTLTIEGGNTVINDSEGAGGIDLNGTVEAGSTVTVNGQPASVTGSNWSINLATPADGDLTVTVVATDAADNEDTLTETLTIDTTAPTITSIVPSPADITEANVGSGTFTIVATFDEDMDQGVAPTLTLAPTLTGLTLASGQWTSDTEYTYTFDVADNNEDVSDVAITVSGGQDLAGNTAGSMNGVAFDFDTLNPLVVEPADTEGGVTEVADGDGSEGTASLTTTGDIDFTDNEIADTHTYSSTPVVGGGAGYVGFFSFGETNPATGDGAGVATWTFSVDDADVDFLREGEVLTQSYDVTITDNNGGVITERVTIEITGTNDLPVIQSVSNPAGVLEDVAGGMQSISVAGSLVVDDDDNAADNPNSDGNLTGDTLSGVVNGLVSAELDGDDASGNADVAAVIAASQLAFTSTAMSDGGDQTLNFEFSTLPGGADLDFLAVDEVLTLVYDVAVNDGFGNSTTDQVTITITGTNDDPIASADTGGLTEDDGTTGLVLTGVLNNDNDPDATDTLSVSAVVAGTGTAANGAAPATAVQGEFGTLTLNADGTYSYTITDVDGINTLGVGDSEQDVFTYEVADGNGGVSEATLTITIDGSNDAPTANASGAIMGEDMTLINVGPGVGVLRIGSAADVDDSDTLSISAVVAGMNDAAGAGNVNMPVVGTYGTLTMGGSGGYSYTLTDTATANALAAGESLPETFTYQVSDSNGGFTQAVLTITINGSNDLPTATADTGVMDEDDPALTVDAANGVLFNDTDPDDTDVLSVSGVVAGGGTAAGATVGVGAPVAGTYGALTLNLDGSYSYSITDTAGTNALADGEAVIDTFTYEIDDDNGGTSEATLIITIDGSNDVPVATADTGTVGEDIVALTVDAASGVLANDADDDTSDMLSVSAVVSGTGSADGSGGVGSTISGTYGELMLNADGSYDYTITDTASAQALASDEELDDVFTYQISDGNGGFHEATLTVTIDGENDAPTLTAEVAAMLDTVGATTAPTTGTLDGDDIDTSNTLTYAIAGGTAVTGGTEIVLSDGGVEYGTLTVMDDGSYSFAPNEANVNALDDGDIATVSTTVEVTDGEVASPTQASFTLTITGTNDAPIITGTGLVGMVTETEAGTNPAAVTGDVQFTDAELGESHVASVTSSDTTGDGIATVVPADYVGFLSSGISDFAFSDGVGTVTWTFSVTDAEIAYLGADETIVQTYAVNVSDGDDTAEVQNVVITINGTNDRPTITGTAVATLGEDGTAHPSVDGADSVDASGTFTIADVDETDEVNATVDGVVASGSGAALLPAALDDAALEAMLSVNDSAVIDSESTTGTLNWEFDSDSETFDFLDDGETLTLTYTVAVTDDSGVSATEAATTTVTVNITGENDAATVDGATIDIDEDTPHTITMADLGYEDVDGDALVSITISGPPSGGTVFYNNGTSLVPVFAGGSISAADIMAGNLSFVPSADLSGTAAANFSFTANDGTVDSAPATITFDIEGVADAPTVVTTDTTGNEDTAIAVDIIAALADISEVLTVVVSGVPAGATLSAGTPVAGEAGSFTMPYPVPSDLTITPPDDFSGDITLTVTATSDDGGDLATTTDTVTISVTGVADAPSLTVADASGDEDLAIALDITSAVTDPSETLSITISGVPTGAMLSAGTDNGGGSWSVDPGNLAGLTITPPSNASDDFTLTVTATSADGADTADTVATIDVTVNAVADAPTLDVTAASGNEDTAIALDIMPALTDPSEVLSVVISGVPIGATLSAGTSFGPGAYEIALGDLATLTITPPVDDSSDFDLTVTATSTDGVDTADTTQTLSVSVTGVADAPTLTVADVTGDEDTPIALTITSALTDASETLSIEISGVPTGATLSAGTDNTDGSWSLTPGQLSGLTITPPADSNDDFTLTVTAASDDDGDMAFTTDTIDVTVNPVNDDPVAEDFVVGDVVAEDEGFAATFGSIIPLAAIADDIDSTLTPASFSFNSVTVEGAVQPDLATAGISYDGSTGDFSFDGTAEVYQSLDENEEINVVVNFTVDDGAGGTDTGSVTFTVRGTNDIPVINTVASELTVGGQEDATAITGSIVADDADDGASLSYGIATGATNGTASIDANGDYTYVPNDDFNGTDTFDVAVSDGLGGVDTVTVTVNVAAVNDDPVVDEDGSDLDVSGDEDATSIDGTVLATDVDPDVLTFTASGSGPANGSVTVNSSGTYSYVPDADFNGTDSFEVTVSDGAGGSDVVTVNVTVNPVNDDPVIDEGASNLLETGDEDTDITGTIVAFDIDGDTLSYGLAASGDPANGSVVIDSSGNFTYTPDDNFNGADSFTVEVSDGAGGSDTVVVNITVDPVNDAPTAVMDTLSGSENAIGFFNVLTNDSDIDGDVISAVSIADVTDSNTTGSGAEVTLGANGGSDSVSGSTPGSIVTDMGATVTLLENGQLTYDMLSDSAMLAFNQLAAGDTIVDTISYEISDGVLTTTNTVEFTITGVNDAVVASDDVITATEAGPDDDLTGNLLENDFDVDLGDTKQITSIAPGANVDSVTNTLTGFTVVMTSGAIIHINRDTGDFTLDLDAMSAETEVVNFGYVVQDGGGTSDLGSVTLTLTGENDAPRGEGTAELANGTEDTGYIVSEADLLAGFSDVEGDVISVANLVASDGLVADNGDGTYTVTPSLNFNGTVTLTYDVVDETDGVLAAQTLSYDVDAVNDDPIIDEEASDLAVSGDEDAASITGTVLASDVDGDTLTFSITGTAAANGSVTIDPSTGAYTYTPNADFNGTDSFEVTVSDGELTDVVTVNVTVDAVNDDPIITDGDAPLEASGDEDTAITGMVAATDVDGDVLTFSITGTAAANGTVTIDPSTGAYTYTPNADFNGTDSFEVTVSDGELTDVVTVNVTVDAVNDDPIITGGDAPLEASGDEDTAITGMVAATDVDGDVLTFSITGTAAANGTVTIDPSTGAYTYTPNADFNGIDSFEVTVSDGELTDVVTVNVTVDAVNDDPIITGGDAPLEASGDEDTAITGMVAATDVDGDTLTFSITGTAAANGSVMIDPSTGAYTYTPNADFNGTDSFEVTVSDGELTDVVTVNVTVDSVNDDPIITDGDAPLEASGDEDTAITGTVAATDVDGDVLTFSITGTAAANGSVTIDPSTGAYTYTPNADFNGTDSFEVTVSDGELTDVVTVNVTVDSVNDDPVIDEVASDLVVSGDEDTAGITGSILAGDVDGDELSYAIDSDPEFGTVTINSDGTYTYVPDEDFTGTDEFFVVVFDGGPSNDLVRVDVTVNPVNDDPVIDEVESDLDVFGDEDAGSIDGTVLATDVDMDGLTFTLADAPTDGTVTVNTDGTYSYTPNEHFFGDDDFDVMVSDGQGGTDVVTVNVTVAPVNDDVEVPANVDLGAIDEDGTRVITSMELLAAAFDVDNDVLTISDFEASSGSLTFDEVADEWTFTADPDDESEVTFTFNVSDGQGSTAASGATLDLTPVNDAPVVAGVVDLGTVANDTSITFTEAELLALASDVDVGDNLTVTNLQSSAGTLVMSGMGTWDFTPAAGDIDDYTFTFDVSDGTETTAASATLALDVVVSSGTQSGGDDVFNGTDGDDVIDVLGGNDVVNALDGNDTVSDGSGNDTVNGGAGDDTFIAGTGANAYDGGDGSDTLDYSAFSRAISINLDTESTDGGFAGNAAGNDTFTDIENVIGGNGGDTLIGNDEDNTLVGGAGEDTLVGAGGNDTFEDGSGNDSVDGGDGDDMFIVGSGANDYIGGLGSDTLDYSAFSRAISINLETESTSGGASGNAASNDSFSGIENVIGSRGGDTLTGNGDDNTLDGGSGNDTLSGAGGNDTISDGSGTDTVDGGDGDDMFIVGTGANAYDGGAGSDTVDYSAYNTGLRINLTDGTTSGGGSGNAASNDTITGVENIIGSNGLDRLFGDDENNTFYGGTGNDTLSGRNGDDVMNGEAGNDRLFGGSGSDTLNGGDGDDFFDGGGGDGVDTLTGGAGADTFHFDRGEGTDVITDFEAGVDTLEFDNFSGLTVEADAFTFASQVGDDVVFDFGEDGLVTVEDITIAQLTGNVDIV